VSLGLLDNSLPPVLSEAVIQGFLTIYVLNRDEVVSLMPPTPNLEDQGISFSLAYRL
jgi:hypothetical protein